MSFCRLNFRAIYESILEINCTSKCINSNCGTTTYKVCWNKHMHLTHLTTNNSTRGGSRAAAISRMECFVIIVNGFQPLTIITKHSILDVVAALDPPLSTDCEISSKLAIV